MTKLGLFGGSSEDIVRAFYLVFLEREREHERKKERKEEKESPNKKGDEEREWSTEVF